MHQGDGQHSVCRRAEPSSPINWNWFPALVKMSQERGDTQLKKYWNMGLGSGQSTLIGSRSQINISEGIFGMANVCRQRMARGGPLVQSHSQSRAVLKGKSGCKRPSRSSVTLYIMEINSLTGSQAYSGNVFSWGHHHILCL